MIRILIADDQELIRDSLRLIVSSDERFEVVAMAKDGREAVEMAKKYRPDVVLLDIRMPEINGLECVHLIKGKMMQLKL